MPLIITNGDSAVAAIQQAGIEGERLPWRDVLHDGPAPRTPSLASLSKIRARYIAGCGWGDEAGIFRDFQAWDEWLLRTTTLDEIVHWFEHDLYDQLQLLQVLHVFATASEAPVQLFTSTHTKPSPLIPVVGIVRFGTNPNTQPWRECPD